MILTHLDNFSKIYLRKETLLKISFFLLVFIFPLQTSTHFICDFSIINGRVIDYLVPTIYLSDFLIGLIFVLDVWVYRNSNFLNILFLKREILGGGKLKRLSGPFFWFFLFIGWSFLSLLFSVNYEAGFYKLLKLTEFILLAWWISLRIKGKREVKLTLLIFASSLFYEVPIIFGEWYNQSSLGLQILGEWQRTALTAGIAKVLINGNYYLRPYGTFPHPNILGGYISFSLLILLFFFFDKKDWVKTQGNKFFKIMTGFSFGWIFFLGFWALILTFSRTAWFIFGIGAILLLLRRLYEINLFQRARLSILKSVDEGLGLGFFTKTFHFRPARFSSKLARLAKNYPLSSEWVLRLQDKVGPILVLVFTGVLGILFLPIIFERMINLTSYETRSVLERIEYIKLAWTIILKHPFFGVGLNNLINLQNSYSHFFRLLDFSQPVHNIPLVILAETGIVGLALFLLGTLALLINLCKNVVFSKVVSHWKKEVGWFLLIAICLVFIISFFDHYFYTLHQGMFIFWFFIGLIMGQITRQVSF